LHTLPMGGTSSLDLMTAPFESGMLILVLQSASLSEGHEARDVVSVAYSPNGQHIISGSDDRYHSNLGCQNWQLTVMANL
jgi:WD40 repeat protein